MRSNLKALIIGLIVYLAVCLLKYGYETIFETSDVIASQNRIFFFAATVLALLQLVVPSYVSGWKTVDKGTFIGFLVAAIGFSARLFLLSVKWRTLSVDLVTMSIWLEQAIVPVTVGAMSGAAGQLHRMFYNK